MRRTTLRDQRGTAVTETMMLTWIVILFVAATLQLFRTNQAIYSSIVGAHLLMFEGAWKANCYQKQDKCIYNSDGHAQVIWRPQDMPEVLVPKVGMFQAYLPGELAAARVAWRRDAAHGRLQTHAHGSWRLLSHLPVQHRVRHVHGEQEARARGMAAVLATGNSRPADGRKRTMRDRGRLIAAIVAGIAAVVLTWFYISSREASLLQQSTPQNVVVATADIPGNSVIQPGTFEVRQVPAAFAQPRALPKEEDVEGRVAMVPDPQGHADPRDDAGRRGRERAGLRSARGTARGHRRGGQRHGRGRTRAPRQPRRRVGHVRLRPADGRQPGWRHHLRRRAHGDAPADAGHAGHRS